MSLNRSKAENLPRAGKSNVKPHVVASNTNLFGQNLDRQVRFHAFGSGFGEEYSLSVLSDNLHAIQNQMHCI